MNWIWSLVWIDFLSNLFASSHNRGNFYYNRQMMWENCWQFQLSTNECPITNCTVYEKKSSTFELLNIKFGISSELLVPVKLWNDGEFGTFHFHNVDFQLISLRKVYYSWAKARRILESFESFVPSSWMHSIHCVILNINIPPKSNGLFQLIDPVWIIYKTSTAKFLWAAQAGIR